jgi:hypothetical protein
MNFNHNGNKKHIATLACVFLRNMKAPLVLARSKEIKEKKNLYGDIKEKSFLIPPPSFCGLQSYAHFFFSQDTPSYQIMEDGTIFYNGVL